MNKKAYKLMDKAYKLMKKAYKLMDKRAADGICVQCGKNPPAPYKPNRFTKTERRCQQCKDDDPTFSYVLMR